LLERGAALPSGVEMLVLIEHLATRLSTRSR